MESKERSKQIEEAVIESYKQEEEMMILVFAQWCVNQGVDPEELYRQAYPNQQGNERLQQVLKLVVPKDEAGDIPDETVLGVLSMFGNDDLAMVVAETISARK